MQATKINSRRAFEPFFSLCLILLVSILGFGIHVTRLGFTWDDYASIFVYLKDGQAVFSQWFGGQGRPLGGYLSGMIWETFGIRAELWHALNWILYLLSVVLVWRILRLIWSDQPTLTTLIALLFAVYPSYHLRPIIISTNLVGSLVVMLTSFWLSLWGLKRQNGVALLAAGALVVVYPLIYEQPLPYELLRLAVFFFLIHTHQPALRDSLRQTVLWWSPIGAGILGFLVYRGFIYQPNETYASYNAPVYLDSFDGWLLTFKWSIVEPVSMLVVDWVRMPWQIFAVEGIDVDLAGLLGILMLGGGLVYLYFYPIQERPRAALPTLGVCVLMLPLLLLAVHLVGQAVSVGFNSRWTLMPSPLAAVILGMGLAAVLPLRHAQVLLVCLIALGLAVQTGVNQLYRADWELRRELGWQLLWRAPQLEAGTMVVLVLDEDDFAFGRRVTDYELTTHLNLYYTGEAYPHIVAPDAPSVTVLLGSDLPEAGHWSEVMSGRRIAFRDWDYDSQQMLVVGYDGGCLRTAHPQTIAQPIPSRIFLNLAPYQNLGQIRPQNLPQLAYSDVVAPEPAHTWCFYYQSIQWHLQMGMAEEAAALADEARLLGYAPRESDQVEWLPLIEAYHKAGRFEQVDLLLKQLAMSEAWVQAVACQTLAPSASDGQIQDHLPMCAGQ